MTAVTEMALGPGKYDYIATAARQITWARGVIVIVLGGKDGSGFSVQTEGPDITPELPAILRDLASKIEADVTVGSGD